MSAVKGALADVGAGPGATRTVSDAASLARALQDPDIRAVLLSDDVTLSPSNWGAAGPVLVTRRTLIGTDPPGAKRTLDFGRMQSAIVLSESTRLVLQNLFIKGCAPRSGVAVDVSGFARLRPAGISLYPTLLALPNSTLVLDDARVEYIADEDWGPGCTNFRSHVEPQLAGLGYTDASFEGPNDLVLPDFHGFDVPLQNLAERGAPVVGQVAIRTDGVVLTCVPPPPPGSTVLAGGGMPPPGSTVVVTDESTGGRGSIGLAAPEFAGRGRFHWWQGLAIGLAAGLILLLSLGVAILSPPRPWAKSCRRPARATIPLRTSRRPKARLAAPRPPPSPRLRRPHRPWPAAAPSRTRPPPPPPSSCAPNPPRPRPTWSWGPCSAGAATAKCSRPSGAGPWWR